jgi:hypothetical protein
MLYPCNECIVSASCSEDCLDLYLFINKAANDFNSMTSNQLRYIQRLPTKLRERIKAFSLLDFQYTIREYTDCTEVGIEKKDTKEKIYDLSM